MGGAHFAGIFSCALFASHPDYRQRNAPYMGLVEIWEPERRYIWMKRWVEAHRRRKGAAQTLARLIAAHPKKHRQLDFGFL